MPTEDWASGGSRPRAENGLNRNVSAASACVGENKLKLLPLFSIDWRGRGRNDPQRTRKAVYA
jgi:hypothetical protein